MREILSEIFLNEWVADALIDSVKTIPFLFFVFLFIELFEHFWANKIRGFLTNSKKTGPLSGALMASVPQCGFSVVASALYTERFISRGTVIAVYLATSDEAIPVILTYPEYSYLIFPLIAFKIILGTVIGYLTDLFIKDDDFQPPSAVKEEHIEGCCCHEIASKRKRDFFIHPVKHTFNIFIFILLITLVLNYFLRDFSNGGEVFFFENAKYLPEFIASIAGLIPNCAISVGLVILFVKGAISFSAMFSGLATSSGLGLLILFKNNKNKKDTALILLILLLTGFLSGVLIRSVEVFGNTF